LKFAVSHRSIEVTKGGQIMVRRVFVFLTIILLFIIVPTLNNQAALPPITILYSVNSDQDYTDANIGDGFCDTGPGTGSVCTLRAAIQEANRDNMPSLIKFASQMSINYPTLEALSEADTTIDGGDQWDGTWPFGRPGVKIGAGGYTSGLLVVTGDNTKIYALEFNGGGNTGISVNAGNGTQIGGLGTNQRNVFRVVSSNSTGVNIGSATDVSIVGNYFGTFDGITAETVDGEYGIYLTGSGVTISDNVIGGQSVTGIQSWMGGGHTISNNIIGLDKNRDHALPNGIGIIIEQSDGSTIGPFNTVSGNSSHGIYLHLADQNHLTGNDIGYSESNGGDGIRLHIHKMVKIILSVEQGYLIVMKFQVIH
jgi:CSLREA domain-containing protein